MKHPLALALLAFTACSAGAELDPKQRAGGGDASAPVIGVRLERTVATFPVEPKEIAFSPDSRLLATSRVDDTIQLWRVSDGGLERTIVHPGGVAALAFGPSGELLASGGFDGTVRLWRVADGAAVRTLAGHEGTVWTLDFAPDGRRLASGGEDRTVKLWRTTDGALERTLAGHALNVWCVRFSPDGRTVASGSFDKTARLWDAETGALERTLTGHTEAVVHLDFSPDGRLLATSGDDNTARLWSTSDGAPVRTLAVGNHVYSVLFSPDGRWLATGGREKSALGTAWKQVVGRESRLRGARGTTIRLWRASDGALVRTLAEHWDDIWSLAFSPDGRWLASSSEDRTVKLWRLDQVSPAPGPAAP